MINKLKKITTSISEENRERLKAYAILHGCGTEAEGLRHLVSAALGSTTTPTGSHSTPTGSLGSTTTPTGSHSTPTGSLGSTTTPTGSHSTPTGSLGSTTTPTKRWVSNGVELHDRMTGDDIKKAVQLAKEKQAADRKMAALRKPTPNHPTYDDYVIECELEEDNGKLSYTDWQYCKENGVEGPTWACDAWEQASAHAAYALLSKRDGKPWVPYPLQTTLVEEPVG